MITSSTAALVVVNIEVKSKLKPCRHSCGCIGVAKPNRHLSSTDNRSTHEINQNNHPNHNLECDIYNYQLKRWNIPSTESFSKENNGTSHRKEPEPAGGKL
jgi:hypothetical protein